jgi:deoxyribodipyrimidine photolyase-related protein
VTVPLTRDTGLDTVWIWGDQLNQDLAHLRGRDPAGTRVLMVVSERKLTERTWHRQKVHLVITAMRRFAAELTAAGFAVDLRRAPSMRAGLHAHVDAFAPGAVVAMEPASRTGTATLQSLGVETVDNDHFLCHWSAFAEFRAQRKRTTMEDFYRWRRATTGWLMVGEEPVGGRWNLDADNRRPPHAGLADESRQAPPLVDAPDAFDADLDAWLPDGMALTGAPSDGTWATSRAGALARLERFVTGVLPRFGDHQDAMVAGAWHLNHSLLSHALNLGLLSPAEVCEAAIAAHADGTAPLNAVEGFVRQVLGWREYLWGIYRTAPDDYATRNALDARQPLPPVLSEGRPTAMRCVEDTLRSIDEHAYAHHIQRLMVLANLATLAGIRPDEFTDWMHGVFIDAFDWVMVPNVIGMGTFADGGEVATKPYIAGGAYIDRMSRDYCGNCRFDRSARIGADACPFTTLYWDTLDRNRETLRSNHRLARPYANLERLADRDALRARADEVRRMLADGTL